MATAVIQVRGDEGFHHGGGSREKKQITETLKR